MADDITLTVRVRDMTRGEFAQIRQRMHGMDGDLRRVARSTSGASTEAARMSRNIQDLSGRMQQLHTTGGGARSEMVHMRTTMGLLGRQLRMTARDGGLTEDEFRSLSRQLERTRLDFDHLARDINRHSSEANTAMRVAAQQQRADLARQVAYARAHTAALQEEARRQAAIQAGEAGRLRRTSGAPTLNMGGDGSGLRRMSSGLQSLQNSLRGITGSSAAARRNIQLFNGDMNAMSRILQAAQSSGTISRQDFDDLSSGVRLADQNMRNLRRSGDLSGGTLRSMRNDVRALQAQLRVLGGEGGRFNLINSRLLLLRRNLRDTSQGAGLIRRAFSRLGDWGLGGLMRMNSGLGLLARSVIGLGRRFAALTRFMKMFILVAALMAPAAQALGAILVTVLGAAFIALGAFALKGNAEVKAAFQDMKSTVGGAVKEAALPMKDHLVAAMRNVGIAAREMQPALTQAFAAAGPLINDMFGAFTNFAASALPGFTTAMKHSQEAMGGFRQAMGLIGKGFGDMFTIITKGNEKELARAWVLLGNEIRNVLESLGEFISTALNSGTASMLMVGFFRLVTGALNVMAAVLDTLDVALGGLFTKIADGISGFGKMGSTMGSAFKDSVKPVAELKKELADVNDQIAKAEKIDISQFDLLPEGARKIAVDAKTGGLNTLQERRVELEGAIAEAAEKAAAATTGEARSVSDLIKQIQSLADLNRGFLDAVSAQEAAIDAAEEGAGKYSDALKFTNGQLDLTTKAAQEAYGFLSKIGQTTKEATDKAIEAKVPWEQIRERWKLGHEQIVKLGESMKLSAGDAKKLADLIMGAPLTKETFFKVRTEEAIASLDTVATAFRAQPGEKVITVKALGQDAIALLQQIGFEVERLPDGQFQITAETADAETNVGRVQAARDALKGKNITLSAEDMASGIAKAIKSAVQSLTDHSFTITAHARTVYETIGSAPTIASGAADALRRQAEHFGGGSMGGRPSSLPKNNFASGGSISGRVLEGRGTKTSDSLTARLSRGEFVMRASAVDKYGPAFMDSVNRGTFPGFPGFAKGGNTSSSAKAKAKAEADTKARAEAAKRQREAQAELRGQMSRSRFGTFAGQRFNPMERGLGAPQDLSSLVNSLNALNGSIKRAFSGSKESSLLKQLDRYGKALIKHEKNLGAVNKRLDAAKDKLADLKQAAGSLKESVRGGVLSAATIMGAGGGREKTLTVSDLMTQLTQGRDKASAFAGALEELKKRGLDKGLIEEIAQAGIGGGGLETAGAVLRASKSEIESMNNLRSSIARSAAKAGTTAADALYGAGIKAAEGLIKGLTNQKKAIEKAMMDIAKAMEKAIKHALGIKSPSKVMQDVGHFTAEGFAVGMQKNTTVGQAWDSMLTTSPSVSRTGGGSYGGGVGQNVFQIYIGDKKVDEVILDSNRRTVRTHGGNVQSTYGRKNG